MIAGTEKKLIVDTESPVKMLPPDKEMMEDNKIVPITRNYQDVNKNEIEFTGKITVKAESRGIRKTLPMFNTEREEIKPLLGMDWLRELNWMIRHIEKTTTITDQSEKDKIFTNFEKVFKTSRTIKDTESEMQRKPGYAPKKTDN